MQPLGLQKVKTLREVLTFLQSSLFIIDIMYRVQAFNMAWKMVQMLTVSVAFPLFETMILEEVVYYMVPPLVGYSQVTIIFWKMKTNFRCHFITVGRKSSYRAPKSQLNFPQCSSVKMCVVFRFTK